IDNMYTLLKETLKSLFLSETNLKIKQATTETAILVTPQQISQLNGHPNNSLYTYDGILIMNGPNGSKQGAQLKNTPWIYGVVIFTGHETKLMRNASATPIKRTSVEKMVNIQIIFLFGILLTMSLACSIGSAARTLLATGSLLSQFGFNILTFLILFNNLIPISLIVTMEVVKFQQAALINSDLDMYYEKTDTPALCRTSSLVEELGQRAHVVDGVEVGLHDFKQLKENLKSHSTANVIDEFFTLLAVCHTVIPERKNNDPNDIVYQASSPDEGALVKGALILGYKFLTRRPKSVTILVNGKELEYEILSICEFNSTRKRMSTIVRGPDGKIKLYCKGADTVILERLADGRIAGHWTWGTTLYTAVLATVLGKAALITNPVFYLTVLLIPVICLLRDIIWKYAKRMYHTRTYHTVQEIQKFNIPDYRPRMEQFQKAIRKVRAVQRLRKSRGFAFSQNESGQESKLIRIYDTTKAKPMG
ncbi:9925_t:CDS:10, partial [Entrophospora sp. SA101]